MSNLTLIITENPETTCEFINKNNKKIQSKSKTGATTKNGDRIILKKPDKKAVKGIMADIVINETENRLEQHTGKPDALKINTNHQHSIEPGQKAKERIKQKHVHNQAQPEKDVSSGQTIYRCSKCRRSLGTQKEISKWFKKQVI